MARSAARCSTGWWVGPSSPRPMESMRHYEYRADPHHRRQADCGSAIVGEAHERASVGDQTAMQRKAVHRRGHAMLAHAVVDIGTCVFAGCDLDLPSRLGVVRGRKVRRAAQQFGNGGEKVVEHGAARRTGRHLLAAADKLLLCLDDRLLPVGRQNAVVAAFELAAQRVWRGFHSFCPRGARLAASGADVSPFASEALRE